MAGGVDFATELKSNSEIKALVNYDKAFKECVIAEKELNEGSVELHNEQLQSIYNSCVKERDVWKYILKLIQNDQTQYKKEWIVLEEMLKQPK